MIKKPDYKPAIVSFVGFLIMLAIAMFVPVDFLRIMISIFAGALLYNSYLCWISPTVIVSNDEWQITDVPNYDDKFK